MGRMMYSVEKVQRGRKKGEEKEKKREDKREKIKGKKGAGWLNGC